ncbi:phage tail tape measure protein [Kaistia sp. MMO-174]|uniref:phage tail tape measure protein n=1 Tax=Kaistia sp. MMO-174 TaxID=3081256 RepID=UPI0030175E21
MQSAKMKALTDELNKAQAAARNVAVFRDAQEKLKLTRRQFNEAKTAVEQAAKTLASAGEEASTKMRTALTRAQREVRNTATAYQTAASKAKEAYAGIGGSIDNVIGAEARLRGSIEQTTAAIRQQQAAEREQAGLAGRRRFNREVAGVIGSAGAIYLGQKTNEAVRSSAETYKEFDDTRRLQKAILGLTPEQQRPFLDQAFHMGATTRFNDLQVMEAQTSLAQRGVKRDFIIPFVGEAANYAGAMGTDLPEAVKTLEGIIFGTGKHIEDAGEAMATMRRVVDQSVKLAKIGGLDDDDIKDFFKFGAMPGSTAGLSDETMGAIAALMKRANIPGAEAGVAMRTASAKLVSPTKKGIDALYSMGIDYSDFAKGGPIDAGSAEKAFRGNFGKSLTPEGRAALAAALEDGDVMGDQGAFVEAFTAAASGSFEKKKDGSLRASDANKIAKFAQTYWKNSVESVDTEGLLRAIMAANPTLAQLNAFFTDKHGGKFSKAFGSPEMFEDYRKLLATAPENFAGSISDERQGGFSGAADRLSGSIKNLETAIGRAFDANGEGGVLTTVTDLTAKTVQHLSEINPNLLAFGGALGAIGSKVAEFTAAWNLTSTLLEFRASTALSASAAELTAAAGALTRAAGAQAGGAAVGGVGGKGGFLSNLLGGISTATILGTLYYAGSTGIDAGMDALPHPDYPQGYDPKTYDFSTLGTLKRLWNDMPPLVGRREGAGAGVDGSALDETKGKAEAAGVAVDALNTTVRPTVDTTSLDEALGKLAALSRGLGGLSSAASRVSSGVDQKLRAIHADTGVTGVGHQ